MKGWTVKKIILRCFFATGLFYLHEKFQLSQSSPSCILSKNDIFFIIFVGKIFFLQNVYGFTPVKFFLSDLGENWAKTEQLLLKRFQLLIAMEGCIVQWRAFCFSWRWRWWTCGEGGQILSDLFVSFWWERMRSGRLIKVAGLRSRRKTKLAERDHIWNWCQRHCWKYRYNLFWPFQRGFCRDEVFIFS